MSDQNFTPNIRTAADLKGAQELKRSLEETILQTKALGDDSAALEARLQSVNAALTGVAAAAERVRAATHAAAQALDEQRKQEEELAAFTDKLAEADTGRQLAELQGRPDLSPAAKRVQAARLRAARQQRRDEAPMRQEIAEQKRLEKGMTDAESTALKSQNEASARAHQTGEIRRRDAARESARQTLAQNQDALASLTQKPPADPAEFRRQFYRLSNTLRPAQQAFADANEALEAALAAGNVSSLAKAEEELARVVWESEALAQIAGDTRRTNTRKILESNARLKRAGAVRDANAEQFQAEALNDFREPVEQGQAALSQARRALGNRGAGAEQQAAYRQTLGAQVNNLLAGLEGGLPEGEVQAGFRGVLGQFAGTPQERAQFMRNVNVRYQQARARRQPLVPPSTVPSELPPPKAVTPMRPESTPQASAPVSSPAPDRPAPSQPPRQTTATAPAAPATPAAPVPKPKPAAPAPKPKPAADHAADPVQKAVETIGTIGTAASVGHHALEVVKVASHTIQKPLASLAASKAEDARLLGNSAQGLKDALKAGKLPPQVAKMATDAASKAAKAARFASRAGKAAAVAGKVGSVAGKVAPVLGALSYGIEAGELIRDFEGTTSETERKVSKGGVAGLAHGYFNPIKTVATAIKIAREVRDLERKTARANQELEKSSARKRVRSIQSLARETGDPNFGKDEKIPPPPGVVVPAPAPPAAPSPATPTGRKRVRSIQSILDEIHQRGPWAPQTTTPPPPTGLPEFQAVVTDKPAPAPAPAPSAAGPTLQPIVIGGADVQRQLDYLVSEVNRQLAQFTGGTLGLLQSLQRQLAETNRKIETLRSQMANNRPL